MGSSLEVHKGLQGGTEDVLEVLSIFKQEEKEKEGLHRAQRPLEQPAAGTQQHGDNVM